MEDRLQSMAQFTIPQSSSSGVATTSMPRVTSKGATKVMHGVRTHLRHVHPPYCEQIKVNVALQPSNEDSELVGDTDGQGFGIGVVSSKMIELLLFIAVTAGTNRS